MPRDTMRSITCRRSADIPASDGERDGRPSPANALRRLRPLSVATFAEGLATGAPAARTTGEMGRTRSPSGRGPMSAREPGPATRVAARSRTFTGHFLRQRQRQIYAGQPGRRPARLYGGFSRTEAGIPANLDWRETRCGL